MVLLHDEKIDIAVSEGKVKKKIWKKQSWYWSDIVKKLSVSTPTSETWAEYEAGEKDYRDNIKDVGGYMGGLLYGARRLKASVIHRQLITLDADTADQGLWELFTLLYDCAAVLHSSHSHSAKVGKFRIVLPLSRPVNVDEWRAISRKLAGNLGLQQFCKFSFVVHQPMFWPSHPYDTVPVFEFQDGDWLNPDTVLAEYADWHDLSQWPGIDKERAERSPVGSKQEDPTLKDNNIGVFCRVYTVSEAIDKFLSDKYVRCDTDDQRYTYVHGSTSGGLVLYEDKWAYSHHGTDPASEELCNAFDLVRLHLFKDQDLKATEGTELHKLPSQKLMEAFCLEDPEYKLKAAVEANRAARKAFETGPVVEDDKKWMLQLDMDQKSNIKNTPENVLIILRNDKRLVDCFAYDAFQQREVALRDLPWRKITDPPAEMVDQDDAAFRNYLSKHYKITTATKIKDAFDQYVLQHQFHPVRDYLNELHWDGVKRLDTIFLDYMGAEDSEYARAVTRKTVVGAVARVFNPGVKFDYVLVLVGLEGKGKSTLLDKMGRRWFSDSFSFASVHKKEATEQLQGAWIVEIGELSGMRKAEIESVKHFISKRIDRFRVAYGKRVQAFPRQCIFFGTTNDSDFLQSPHGNRRFWPLRILLGPKTRDVFTDFTSDEIDQVWAEALVYYKKGEPLYLNEELEKEAAKVQTFHTSGDERIESIKKYLDRPLPENWYELPSSDRCDIIQGSTLMEGTPFFVRNKVSALEIFCELFRRDPIDASIPNLKFIRTIMNNLPGWEGRQIKGKDNTNTRGFIRTSPSPEVDMFREKGLRIGSKGYNW